MIPVVLLIVQIALLVWVAKDSKSRGMDNAVVWMIFVFLAPVIGLIVYILAADRHAGEMRLLRQHAVAGGGKVPALRQRVTCGCRLSPV